MSGSSNTAGGSGSVLLGLIDSLEAEKITEVEKANPSAAFEERPELSPCYDCGEAHLPRRVVCCVDGTWMDADGNTSAWASEPNHNASNVFRIWASIREGIVMDTNGQPWQQIRRYFKGIGADLDDSLGKIIAGITGNGFEIEIYKVYTFCAFNCCPSRDEIWLFGFSRGAYIVRAVAALMDHMGLLKPEMSDYRTEYWEGLRVYRNLRDKAEFHKHQYYQHLVQNTRPAPRVRFVGVLDTVKAVSDANLYDLSHTPTTDHVRHALALFERRDNFKPSLYRSMKSEIENDRSCVEAWFMGGHGNIGGAQVCDGLALWPLQYLLSEAQHLGLVLGFQVHERARIDNPLDYTMPDETEIYDIPFKGGLNLTMWDITPKFVDNLAPLVYIPRAAYDSVLDREIPALQASDKGYSHIVHPSVYLHDDIDILGVVYLKNLGFRNQVRAYRKQLGLQWGQLFWNRDFTRELNGTLDKPRVLVCGPHGVGKSSLINLVLGEAVATENSSFQSQEHTINREYRSESSPFVFHDSIGFDLGNDEPYEIVQDFINSRKQNSSFVEQLHCIWYCLPADLTRMSTADQKFFDLVDFDGIELKIVFTQCDKLRDSSFRDACSLYCTDRPGTPVFYDLMDFMDQPENVKSEVMRLASHVELQKREEAKTKAVDFLGIAFRPTSHFVSRLPRDKSALNDLIHESTEALRSEVLQRIHLRAINTERERLLKTVVSQLVALKSRRPLVIANDLMKKENKIYFFEAQKIVAKAFKMEVADDAFFRNLHEVVEAMLGIAEAEKQSFIKEIWESPITQMLLGGIGGTVAVAFLGPIASAGLILNFARALLKTKHDRAVFELDSLCTVILVYDRMFWFGTPLITRRIAQRGWIEYFKIYADLERTVKKEVNSIASDDWHEIITKVIDQYKYKP